MKMTPPEKESRFRSHRFWRLFPSSPPPPIPLLPFGVLIRAAAADLNNIREIIRVRRRFWKAEGGRDADCKHLQKEKTSNSGGGGGGSGNGANE